MTEREIPSQVTDFLSAHIDSVVQLELLLALYRDRERPRDAASLAQELRIDPVWAELQLTHLCAHRLATCGEGAAPYQYKPATPELDGAVHELDRLYVTHRVSIISLIFAKPLDKIRGFADAFRLRKDTTDG